MATQKPPDPDKDTVCKFVRVGEEIRTFSLDIEHKSQVKDGETAAGAGMIVIFRTGWKWLYGSSDSLNIDATWEDEQAISEFLNLHCRNPGGFRPEAQA